MSLFSFDFGILDWWTGFHFTTHPVAAEEDAFFLTLLPPKVAIEAEDPVAAQLSFRPPVAAVVSLSELLKERPEHVVSTLQKALSRLAPNCRLFWGSDPWIMHRVNQVPPACLGIACPACMQMNRNRQSCPPG